VADQTVLVTGGTGYVASRCVAELLRRGYRVRSTIRTPDRERTVRDAVSSVADPADRLSFAVADLTSDEGWDAAVTGADFVLHVASPLGEAARDPDELIVPARDGALRVLRAATSAGVRRVVMTSAANAASPSSYGEDGVTDETLWTDLGDPTLIPYRRAKTIAEKAAWDFMAGYDGPTTLTTVLPGAVFGPILDAGHLGTTRIVARMLGGGMRGAPRIAFEIVDVRDVADIHIRAMTSPAAAGERFLATGELMWMREMALALRSGLGSAAGRAPTREIPDFAVRLAARFFDHSLRGIVPALGRRNRHSTDKARRLLGWQARPAAETVVDCARSLLEANAVPAA
jgi:dihydroflavonol-4-reductase